MISFMTQIVKYGFGLAFFVVLGLVALPARAALVIDRVSAQPMQASQDQPAQVVITWFTNTEARGRVDFGLTTTYGQSVTSTELPSTRHEIKLTGLKSETVYHFKITSWTTAGESMESFDQSFKAPKWKDTTAPSISQVNVTYLGATYAIFTFVTSEPTSSQVRCSSDEKFKKNVVSAGGPSNTTTHEVVVRLTKGQSYFYQVKARDKDNYESIVAGGPFTTGFDTSADQGDLIIDRISPASANDPFISDTTIKFRWHTGRPARGSVEYRSPVRGTKSGRVEEKGFYAADHEVTVTGLRPNTQYFFKISSRDVLGKSSATSDMAVATLPSAAPVTPQPLAQGCKKMYAYGVCRDLAIERQAAIDLVKYLRGLKLRIPAPITNHWVVLLKAHTYGGYPAQAVAQAIRFGGYTVHPSIPWSAWQTSAQYRGYINR